MEVIHRRRKSATTLASDRNEGLINGLEDAPVPTLARHSLMESDSLRARHSQLSQSQQHHPWMNRQSETMTPSCRRRHQNRSRTHRRQIDGTFAAIDISACGHSLENVITELSQSYLHSPGRPKPSGSSLAEHS